MAAFNYASMVATAKRLIARFGRDVTQHVTTGGDGTWPVTLIETNYPLKAAVMEYRNRDVDGTLIQATDKRVIVSTEGMSVTLDSAHKLTIGGIKHSIVNVRELNPGATVVYVEAQVRK